jgi:protein-disulfide isomerase
LRRPRNYDLGDKILEISKVNTFIVISFLAMASLISFGSVRAEELRPLFSPDQRKEIGEVVKEYLLLNPEVLRDASAELEKRTEQQQKAAQSKALEEHWAELVASRGSTIIGNPNGRINLIVFFDHNCPFCRASVDDVQKLIDTNPELRVALREFPILGTDSTDASRVALAVARQTDDFALRGRYYTLLMKAKGQMNGSIAVSTAIDLGLDGTKLRQGLHDTGINSILRENFAFAEALGITGTPAFIAGDQIIVGAVGPDRMQAAISTASR